MQLIKNSIISVSGYLPEQIKTNFDLEKTIDTTNQWIVERTGITKRHIVNKNQNTSDIAYIAANKAIEKANIERNDIGIIILCTTTPDNIFPSTATKIQSLLNIKNCYAFDIQAVCSGFVYGLHIADSLLKNSSCKYALLIGAETLSKIVDWNDRNTCILFGDGAGAAIIERKEYDDLNKYNQARGIISSQIHSDGNYYDILKVSGGISENKMGYIKMDGTDVFKHAVSKMSDSIKQILQTANIALEEIDWLVPHQANLRIINAISSKLNIAKEKVITTIQEHANTSAASIPLALDYSVNNNLFKKNDIIVTTALGGGLSWGSNIIRW